ncbi:MAG: efflux RND transporter periplasmic adaptor subunit [bacterium]|nr:efflux RND transporter periplasmic adaptor subunit [bacterium]
MFIFNFIKSHLILSLVIVVVIAGGSYLIWGRSGETPNEEIVSVTRGTLTQEVSVTGRVKPAESVDLAFERSGRVAAINVDVGAKVSAGQVLASLYNADLSATLADVEASVRKEEAKLAELKRGTRPEELAVQEVKVADARQALLDTIQDAYRKADDAIHNKVDQFIDNPRSSDPNFTVTIPDGSLRTSLENERMLREILLSAWSTALTTLSVSDDLSAEALRARAALSEIRAFLDRVATALASAVPSSSISQTTIEGYSTDVNTARTNINTAITNLAGAESDLAVKTSELALKRAGTALEQIAAQEAALEQARAKVESAKAELAKTRITSPLRGIVTQKNAKVGEIVSAQTSVFSLNSDTALEIEANVPEADIAKISMGNEAQVTLDAYGKDVLFTARVMQIDPAETIVDGVATYRVEFQFGGEDSRIKSGMTANIDIETAKIDGVLVIPQRAVITKNGDKVVRIREAAGDRDVVVQTGLRGSDGNIEIISGLNEGDKVVISFE